MLHKKQYSTIPSLLFIYQQDTILSLLPNLEHYPHKTATIGNSTSNPEDETTSRSSSMTRRTFEQQLNALSAYKLKYGTTNVSREHDVYLSKWVVEMKKAYAAVAEGRPPKYSLTIERKEALEEIGFDWGYTVLDGEWNPDEKKKGVKKFVQTLDNKEEEEEEEEEEGRTTRQSTRLRSNSQVDEEEDTKDDDTAMQKKRKREEKSEEQDQEEEPVIRRRTRQSNKEEHDDDDDGKHKYKRSKYTDNTGGRRSFEEQLEELKKFKKKYGNCNIPRYYEQDESLSRWAESMRVSYRCVQEGRRSRYPITPARIERLKNIGFDFQHVEEELEAPSKKRKTERNIRPRPKANKPSVDKVKPRSFEDNFEALLEYKQLNGHVNVPRDYPHDPSLGRWCQAMRDAARAKKENRPSRYKLTQKRYEMLDELGFQWEKGGSPRGDSINPFADTFKTRSGKRSRSNSLDIEPQSKKKKKDIDEDRIIFEERYKQLEKFSKKNGSCNVPKGYSRNRVLAEWVWNVKKAYACIENDQRPEMNLTVSQIQRLEALGIKWNYKLPTNFYERYEQLRDYKMEYGHCNVPRRYRGKQSLGLWVNNIRIAYEAIRNGQSSILILTKEQIRKLDKLGFEWSLNKPVRSSSKAKNVDEAVERRFEKLGIQPREFVLEDYIVLGETVFDEVSEFY